MPTRRRHPFAYLLVLSPNPEFLGRGSQESSKIYRSQFPRMIRHTFPYMQMTQRLASTKKLVIRHLLDAAKACILLSWKSPHPPTIATWLKKVDDISWMEYLILTSQGRQETYSKTWQLWNLFKYSDEGQLLRGGDPITWKVTSCSHSITPHFDSHDIQPGNNTYWKEAWIHVHGTPPPLFFLYFRALPILNFFL